MSRSLAKVKSSRKRSLLNILKRTKVKLSKSSTRFRRPTSTAEKNKKKKSTSSRRRRSTYRVASKGRKTSAAGKCKTYLKNKIKINMNELKKGKFKSVPMAVAVSYSQVMKKHPACKRVLRRTPSKAKSKSKSKSKSRK